MSACSPPPLRLPLPSGNPPPTWHQRSRGGGRSPVSLCFAPPDGPPRRPRGRSLPPGLLSRWHPGTLRLPARPFEPPPSIPSLPFPAAGLWEGATPPGEQVQPPPARLPPLLLLETVVAGTGGALRGGCSRGRRGRREGFAGEAAAGLPYLPLLLLLLRRPGCHSDSQPAACAVAREPLPACLPCNARRRRRARDTPPSPSSSSSSSPPSPALPPPLLQRR